jgi:hypothetical protein
VVSEVRTTPGPTNSLFDVLAACIAALTPGPRVAVLGFAAGGIVAPLRGMGFGHPIEAVDLSLAGERVFRRHSGPWVGDVEVHEEEAGRWLRRRRRPRDMILEDLSTESGGDVTKPAVSLTVLPPLMRRRLAPRGVVAVNVLPVPGTTWQDLLGRIAEPWPEALVVTDEDYENKILLAGALPDAREVSRTLRSHLRALGSSRATEVSVRSFG